jgi:hypothetical protein
MAKLLNDLKAKERELVERNNALNQLNTSNNITYEQHLQGFMKKPLGDANTNAGSTVVVSETSRQEREHVIKVLEHERRIYKLETSLTKPRQVRAETFDNNSNQEVEPFDSDFGPRQEDKFDGRTSSPMRLGGGQQNSGSKRPRILSDI